MIDQHSLASMVKPTVATKGVSTTAKVTATEISKTTVATETTKATVQPAIQNSSKDFVPPKEIPETSKTVKPTFEDMRRYSDKTAKPNLSEATTSVNKPTTVAQSKSNTTSVAKAQEISSSEIKKQPITNKIEGTRREYEVKIDLQKEYPSKQGYSVVEEVYLRNKEGSIVKDNKTGEARRIDFVVVKDGKAVSSVEVTSNTASKVEQSAKETRIRDAGGNYIKDSNRNLVEIPKDVQTRIERRD